MPTARGATNRQCATQFTNRRTLLGGAAAAVGANIGTLPASANSKSRSDGYEVQRTDREWAYALNGQQYNILRTGGTEPPNSSPLVKEKRAGVFGCAACSNPLFESAQKFDSGTGSSVMWYRSLAGGKFGRGVLKFGGGYQSSAGF